MCHVIYCPHSGLAERQANEIKKSPGWSAQAPLGWAHLHSSSNWLYYRSMVVQPVEQLAVQCKHGVMLRIAMQMQPKTYYCLCDASVGLVTVRHCSTIQTGIM